jgi:hypothetical protein
MSYLHLPSINLADFNTGTISLWFRFSGDSVGKANAHRASYTSTEAPDIFKGTIPLVTFGRKVMAHTYTFVSHPWPFPTGGIGAVTTDAVAGDDAPCEPSHLGIEVSEGEEEGKAKVTLKMIFQTETRAFVQGLVTQAADIHWEEDPTAPGMYTRHDTVQDISYVRTASPETFEIIPKFEVSADEWHHLLVSFDFSNSVHVVAIPNYHGDNAERDTISSTCQIWYAFDDEYKDGQDNMGFGWAHHGPNDVVPISAMHAAFGYIPPPPDPDVSGELYNAEYHWDASPIPMQGGPVGLPASAEYVDTIYHCEMAEFQFFAGLIVTDNRRAFVDGTGKPVKPEDTEKVLGRKPDILLHGTNNWKQGKNTGTTGLTKNDEGEDVVIDAGQFQHIGLIKKYTPDPSLENTTA